MVVHLVRMGAIIILLGLGMVYPFLPGGYDSLAMALSTMAQMVGVFGMLLVPIGVLWLIYTAWKRKPGTYFALVALVAASLVVIAVSFVGAASAGLALGLLTLALWVYIVSRLRLRLLKNAEGINPAPLYLIVIPIATLLLQLVLAAPLTESSRNRAIANSAELMSDIEEYHTGNGVYPQSLLAVWKDYAPGVVGIDQYHYAARGEAYNLVFEQPRFLLDNIGAREFVVYNPLDEQVMISHDSWILLLGLLGPERVVANQGWFEVGDAGSSHWKYFWFD